ncbi:Hypothetical protein PAS_chr2-1_0306 [Komagataella phaffii GS115]|uniref:Uncharacterized protein n=1 Tax=Komagataella phaffii (strain GS115 / ATCC 20864) TaxID=644223 RepID=C4R097_KOMPG|nr:Hypothetical protein PAS_chr2-1_0306 [Komagataella phaffii GS115]CAY68921.1 Hypothetical protein PAS_chr2-1_0306 [Komagataella phaffii GS115]
MSRRFYRKFDRKLKLRRSWAHTEISQWNGKTHLGPALIGGRSSRKQVDPDLFEKLNVILENRKQKRSV